MGLFDDGLRSALGSQVDGEEAEGQSRGLLAGRYRVEIALNGRPAGTREFEVR
jgi:hypothetical protein